MLGEWEEVVEKIEMNGWSGVGKKGMLYRGVYERMVMGVEGRGENGLWSDGEGY